MTNSTGDTLHQLVVYGQSYWLDNLTRRMISGGDLAFWISQRGLRGITANPTTFCDALASEDYDQDISYVHFRHSVNQSNIESRNGIPVFC